MNTTGPDTSLVDAFDVADALDIDVGRAIAMIGSGAFGRSFGNRARAAGFAAYLAKNPAVPAGLTAADAATKENLTSDYAPT